MRQKVLESRHRLAIGIERLKALSPLEKLNKGYAFVEREQENKRQMIKSVSQVAKGDMLTIYMTDGRVKASVTESREEQYGQ